MYFCNAKVCRLVEAKNNNNNHETKTRISRRIISACVKTSGVQLSGWRCSTTTKPGTPIFRYNNIKQRRASYSGESTSENHEVLSERHLILRPLSSHTIITFFMSAVSFQFAIQNRYCRKHCSLYNPSRTKANHCANNYIRERGVASCCNPLGVSLIVVFTSESARCIADCEPISLLLWPLFDQIISTRGGK